MESGSVISNDFKIRDYYFNGDFVENGGRSSGQNEAKMVEFFTPRVILENLNACKVQSSISGRPILFMISLIHSHVNNYLRRKTMRETWLSMRNVRLSELFPDILDEHQDYELQFTHLFVLGNDRARPQAIESIKNESRLFNDILMIDIEENYKNLLYKHLALVNWVILHFRKSEFEILLKACIQIKVSENCQDVSYVLKMDDDVLVNIKSLTRHLIEKGSLKPQSKKFLYCNINMQSLPVRRNTSKWFVHPNTYPFEWYPKYCEGFAYITNLNTVRFMSEQSQRIPRFWIDDVYFTGLLFHGIDDVKWIDYKGRWI